MLQLLNNFESNYLAINHSQKLCDHKKRILLKNMLTDIELVFFEESNRDEIASEQIEEAKKLHKKIQQRIS